MGKEVVGIVVGTPLGAKVGESQIGTAIETDVRIEFCEPCGVT